MIYVIAITGLSVILVTVMAVRLVSINKDERHEG